VLGDRLVQPVPPLAVRDVDLRPGWRQEHLRLIALALIQDEPCGLTGRVLKRHGRIDEAASKKTQPVADPMS